MELCIDRGALDHVVASALRRQTGANGLKAVLAAPLEQAAFECFRQKKAGRVRLSQPDNSGEGFYIRLAEKE